MLGFGTFMMTDNIAFLMFGWFVMMMYVFLKNRITVPRFGYVRFESEKNSFRKGVLSVVLPMCRVRPAGLLTEYALSLCTPRKQAECGGLGGSHAGTGVV